MSFNTNDKFNTLSGTLLQTTTITSSMVTSSLGILSGVHSNYNILGLENTGSFSFGVDYANKTASVSTDSPQPTDLFFKPDGTKMYVLDSFVDRVNQYDLSVAWDVSTATYGSVFATVAAQESFPNGLYFHPSGTYFYVIGTSGDDINQYSMSPAWSLGSATFAGSSSASSEATPAGLFFKPDGMSVFIVGSSGDTIREHNLATPWDVTTFNSTTVRALNISTENNAPSGLFFNYDGTKMFVINSGTGIRYVWEYLLSIPWDISTGNKHIKYDLGLTTFSSSSALRGIFLKTDETLLYTLCTTNTKVYQFNRALQSSTVVGNLQVTNQIFSNVLKCSSISGSSSQFTSITASVGITGSNAQFTTLTASVISASSYLGITGGTSGQLQYNSASTFAGTSGLTYSDTTLSGTTAILPTLTSSQEAIYTTNNMGISTAGGIAATTKTGSIAAQATDANGLFFHPSGTYMYVADNTTDKVYEYSLSTPWDVSTISYTSVTASFGAQENTPHDIFFHPSGTYFYVLGTGGDDINQYSMSPAWSLSSATFVASSSANGYETTPLGMWFKPDGTSVYIVGSTTNTVRQHSVATPWDITTMVTASVVSSYSAVGAITNGQVSGISFSDDGKKMYLISSAAGDRRLYEFYLSTAWDVSTITKYIGYNVANANNTIIASSVLSALYRRQDGSNIYFINNGSVDKVVQYDTKNASLSIGDGVLQVIDGLAVFSTSSFADVTANNLRASAITTISGFAAGSTITAGTTISASTTLSAGGAITGAAGMSISGGPTTIAGGAGQNLTVSTTAIFSGPNANFGSNTLVSGSIAKFDTVIGKYATYNANFTVATASYFSGINSTGGAITASLTGAANYYAGQTLIFKDIGGNAITNNILIQASGSDNIDSNPSYTINTNSGSLTLVCNGVNGFYIV